MITKRLIAALQSLSLMASEHLSQALIHKIAQLQVQ